MATVNATGTKASLCPQPLPCGRILRAHSWLWWLRALLPTALLLLPRQLPGQSISNALATDTIAYSFSAAALLGGQNADSALIPFQPFTKRPAPAAVQPPFTIHGMAERNIGTGGNSQNPRGGMTDLTIEGPLYHGIRTTIRIADQALPFQPQGTSQELRLLNELYIHIYDSSWRLEAGDIRIQAQQNHFLLFTQQARGLLGRVALRTKHHGRIRLHAAFGLPKGQVMRVSLAPIEGVQGPYELQGHRAFTRVVVLANSERVYLDDQLLQRGLDHDYTIDYNLGTITFTARCPISSRSRIAVEYETSQSPYQQLGGQLALQGQWRNGWSMALGGVVTMETKTNSPRAPGSTPQALFPETLLGISSGEMAENRTSYQLRDTTVDGQRYQIYVPTTAGTPSSQGLAVPFCYVGPNQGNYISTQGNNNQQLFLWVAPKMGTPQGSYMPSTEKQQAPRSHLLLEATLGKAWRDSATGVAFTGAYSLQGSKTRQAGGGYLQGGALLLRHHALLMQRPNSKLSLQAQAQWVHRAFRAFLPFVPTPMAHQWGLHDSLLAHDFADASISILQRTPQGHWRIATQGLARPALLGGAASLEQQHRLGRWSLDNVIKTSLVRLQTTRYHQGSVASNVAHHWHYATLGSCTKAEWKQQLTPGNKDLPQDFATLTGGLYTCLHDSTRYSTRLDVLYEQRWDTLHNKLTPSSSALLAKLEGRIGLPGAGTLSATLGYKHFLSVADAWRSLGRNHFLGNLSLQLPLWEHRVGLALLTQLRGETVQRWQLHYIPVPVGQGQYAWLDLNRDGVAQLNEFAPAQHRDQACYSLQYVPSTNKTMATAGESHLTLQISPRARQQPIDSSTDWWLRWDIHLALSASTKRTDNQWYLAPLPWLPQDTSCCPEGASTLQAQLLLNHHAKPIGLTYAYVRTKSHQLLAQGLQAFGRSAHSIALETPVIHGWCSLLSLLLAHEQRLQPYHSSQMVRVKRLELSASIAYETSKHAVHQLTAQFNTYLQEKQNRARVQSYGYRLECPFGDKWQAHLSVTYAHADATNPGNNALSYELLQGLGKGHNGLLEAQLRYKITRYLTGGLTYSFRKNQLSPAVHSGYIQLQASF